VFLFIFFCFYLWVCFRLKRLLFLVRDFPTVSVLLLFRFGFFSLKNKYHNVIRSSIHDDIPQMTFIFTWIIVTSIVQLFSRNHLLCNFCFFTNTSIHKTMTLDRMSILKICNDIFWVEIERTYFVCTFLSSMC